VKREPSPIEVPQSIGGDSRIEAISADIGTIFDTVDIPIVVVNRNYKVALFNRAATESLGLTVSDIGQHSGNIRALSAIKGFDQLCEQVIADEAPCRREIRIGDRLFIVRMAPYAKGKGEIEGAVLTFTNVTAFRASVEQAIYEREYTKSILNTVVDPLVVLDCDLQVQTANRAFYLMFGLSREKTQGVALCDLGDTDWKTSDLWTSLKAILLDDGELHSFEVERDFPAIGRRTILIDARRLPRDGSNSVLLAFRDVTESKRAQAALVEADKRKDEFLATLAHELRNPLAPIRNSLQILRLGCESSGETERIHEMMERQVAHLVRLVDDLLELSRISRGQIELKKERVELATIISSAVETSKPVIEAAGHRLAVFLPSETLVVDGDLVRLSQVFANLLNNAAKYTQNGGDISITAKREDKSVVVSIRDTGIGIPRDKLTHVFEMFAQVDNVLSRSQDGLGIGLSLVRTLVGMHDGRVEAYSDGLGLGSEFVTYLPLAECDHKSTENVNAPKGYIQSTLSTHRVLLVDDNRDSANTLAMLLKLLGTEVKIAYDGESALDALRIYRPSLLLLDIGMPGMDGYDVARQVRQIPEFCDLVLIALTGWGQDEDRRRTKEAGFDHHLVKPVEIGTLQGLLASLEAPSRQVKSAAEQPANIALGPSA
jgi:PAS domain S-box-containing protein